MFVSLLFRFERGKRVIGLGSRCEIVGGLNVGHFVLGMRSIMGLGLLFNRGMELLRAFARFVINLERER